MRLGLRCAKGICRPGPDSAATAYDAGEVDGVGEVGTIGVGVSTVEEERSQERTSRSEPRRREWDAQGAMAGLFDGKVSTMRQGLGH